MENEFKIGFFDLDWTLYDHHNGRWDHESIEAIKEMKRRGHKVVFVTARSQDSAKTLGVFDLGIEWDAFVTSAGAIAFFEDGYQIISQVKEDDVYKFIDLCARIGSTFEIVSVNKRILIGEETPGFEAYYRDFKELAPKQRKYEGEEVTGFNFFDDKEKEEIVKKEFPQFVYYRYHDYAVDITATPHVKGEAMKVVLERFSLTREEAIAFGDGDQDVSMKLGAKVFAVMDNAVDEVKKEGDFITKSVMDSGVKFALEHFGII